MYEVSVDETFAAAHNLRGYKGKCEDLHGHNYKVRVTLAGKELDSVGLLYDFVHLKQVIQSVIRAIRLPTAPTLLLAADESASLVAGSRIRWGVAGTARSRRGRLRSVDRQHGPTAARAL